MEQQVKQNSSTTESELWRKLDQMHASRRRLWQKRKNMTYISSNYMCQSTNFLNAPCTS